MVEGLLQVIGTYAFSIYRCALTLFDWFVLPKCLLTPLDHDHAVARSDSEW